MKALYWGLLAVAVAAVITGFALGNPSIGGLVGAVCALGASAIDPSGRGLARYVRRTGGDDPEGGGRSRLWHNADDA